jgi:C4-dicarboxylate-specific signal transduction histidine kinase
LILSIEDNGPGIAAGMLETVFEPGCSTRLAMDLRTGWTRQHQGLGLSITRAIIEAAGGRVRAENRMEGGARFAIELPAVAR